MFLMEEVLSSKSNTSAHTATVCRAAVGAGVWLGNALIFQKIFAIFLHGNSFELPVLCSEKKEKSESSGRGN